MLTEKGEIIIVNSQMKMCLRCDSWFRSHDVKKNRLCVICVRFANNNIDLAGFPNMDISKRKALYATKINV